MADLLALPQVTDGRDGVCDREEDGRASVGSVNVQAAQNF